MPIDEAVLDMSEGIPAPMDLPRMMVPAGGGLPILLLSALLTGCGSLAGPPPAPRPGGAEASEPSVTPPLEVPVQGLVSEAPAKANQLEIFSPPLRVDPILDSPWALTPEMEEKIQFWIESFQNREAELYRTALARMGRYEGMVMDELRASGLPSSLAFLPIVESWYNPRALSWVGASGLWQFMPSTARGMGLKVDRLIDERRDPYRSTPMALAYLSDLHERFGSWFLALAAYNGGPGRLDRILRGYAPDQEGHDGLFLEVLQRLPRETRDFVPRFLAAARIGRNPEAYGFQDVVREAAWAFEEVVVPDATSLDVVARAGQVDQEALEELNPKLLRGLTPAGISTGLRVPEGVGRRFSEAYAQIPPEERVTFLEHLVTRGETLTHIARRYGVSVDDLRATNPTIEPRRMQIGQRVVVPKAPSVRGRLAESGGSSESGERLVVYRVQAGDTLSAIAARHGVGVNDLLRWNSLSRSSIIRPGDQVRIYVPGSG